MDDESDGSDDGLLTRLRVIEDQPLDARAEAYAALHEQLRKQLESDGTSARTDRPRDDA